MEIKLLDTDVLIIGGGTAGCWAAISLASHPSVSVTIAEKAHIKRSGCLAAGVNALNAYIAPGQTPHDYANYASSDAEGIVRYDLLISAADRFNKITERLENLGLVILKNPDGSYAVRGNRNVKINGENIKPLLAEAVSKAPNVRVLNHVNVTDLVCEDGKACGAVGFDARAKAVWAVKSRAVIVAAGGASGLYRPNNPGYSRHKMWYPPFNTGAGYAMGMRAGAEMTTFEMRFIALRCKDTIAPTGTIAQGVGARQVNSLGEEYESRYGLATWQRLHGAVEESRRGCGPCCLGTAGITAGQEEQLYRAYLNMAPAQTLKWIESGRGPSERNVEIEGTEPYIVGGHTASGYWVDTKRETTLRRLFAAGDAVGGCPQKYVTGAMAEAEIASSAALDAIFGDREPVGWKIFEPAIQNLRSEIERMLNARNAPFSAPQLEEAMQSTMDRDAGGISSGYRYNMKGLERAAERLDELTVMSGGLEAANMKDTLRVFELKDRLLVARCLLAHLSARRETRWGSFSYNLDHPSRDDDNFSKYVNSRYEAGRFEIIFRDIVEGETYEHTH